MKMGRRHFLEFYTYGSLVVLMIAIIGTLSYFGWAYLSLEKKRADVLESHLITFFQFQHRKMSEEAYTRNYESVAARVAEISDQLGSKEFEVVISDNDGKCLYYQTEKTKGQRCIPSEALTNLGNNAHPIHEPLLVYDDSISTHIFVVDLDIASSKQGTVKAAFKDPYGLLLGNDLFKFALKHFLPVGFFIVVLWFLWLTFARAKFLKPYLGELGRLEKDAGKAELASEVAHDIRSPLESIEVFMDDLDGNKIENKHIIMGALARIRDLANNLLNAEEQHRQSISYDSDRSSHQTLIAFALERLISEKRLQYRRFPNLTFDLSADPDSVGQFSSIDVSTFKSVVSNIVDNAVQATHGKGQVDVLLKSDGGNIITTITDRGPGIDPSLLVKIGKNKVASQKQGGSGLGLFNAHKSIEAAGGRIVIDSQRGLGTKIEICLPVCKLPDWFASSITVRDLQGFVVVDDDTGIHEVWRKKIAGAGLDSNIKSFADPGSFLDWYEKNASEDKIFLIDYEFNGSEYTGIDLISKTQPKNCYLVSSHVDNPVLQNFCRENNLKLIPKHLLGSVTFRKVSDESPTCVLIDDDAWVRDTWEAYGRKRGHAVATFKGMKQFLANSLCLDKGTPIFVDFKLSGKERGDQVSERLAEMGFGQIYLATGLKHRNLRGLKHINGVVGKKPPEWCLDRNNLL